MIDIIQQLHPLAQTLLATSFTWAMTAAGAAMVFIAKDFNKKLFDGALGFAGGVMIAASFWSLLVPAIEMSTGQNIPVWVPTAAGFLMGGVFLGIVDKVVPHLHPGLQVEQADGIKTNLHRTTLLVLAITIHNIPEGLAVGVAFGAAALGIHSATLPVAIALAIGIGIQNFPEGMAVSMPLRREGWSCLKCFWYGQLSAVVEPVAGVIGAAAVIFSQPILPFALSFAAGAMIFVVVQEVVPESQREGNTNLATMGAMVGFALMMVLDVALS